MSPRSFDLKPSTSSKTGDALNTLCLLDLPCRKYCYACRGRLGFRTAVELQKHNHRLLTKYADDCEWIDGQARLLARRLKHDDLRICGAGSLSLGMVRLAVALGKHGITAWGFDRQPSMLNRLAYEVQQVCLPGYRRPVFTGSIDGDTPISTMVQLAQATQRLTGRPRLAYMGRTLSAVPKLEELTVVFGYHHGQKKTVLGHPLECPSTAGKDIHCRQCRRCMTA